MLHPGLQLPPVSNAPIKCVYVYGSVYMCGHMCACTCVCAHFHLSGWLAVSTSMVTLGQSFLVISWLNLAVELLAIA